MKYIAQEMEEIDENYVHKTKIKNKDGEDDYDYQINVLSVLSTATKAIQELNAKVNSQEQEINFLKEKINLLLKERSVNNGQNNI